MEIVDSKSPLQEETMEIKPGKKEKKEIKSAIQLERTRTAFERLQLAWIRASLTLITIGVGAYEYFHNRIESGKAPLLKLVSGRELGIFLVLMALVALTLATIQHRKNTVYLKNHYEKFQYSVTSLLSYLIIFLAVFLIGMMVKL
ncbi:YidH family protein [Algoriphagus sp. AK58]|uniref:YidH family protein n=1 Tax=Algoriphagus sp. AK58 TaxID=1406877 RepID=UPI001650C63E|nr:DUF202 domain-containing protein [Algoriphagus sp. AK58]MBC6365424.1 hypothetical protein [Algoriphagus sp. AK58]